MAGDILAVFFASLPIALNAFGWRRLLNTGDNKKTTGSRKFIGSLALFLNALSIVLIAGHFIHSYLVLTYGHGISANDLPGLLPAKIALALAGLSIILGAISPVAVRAPIVVSGICVLAFLALVFASAGVL